MIETELLTKADQLVRVFRQAQSGSRNEINDRIIEDLPELASANHLAVAALSAALQFESRRSHRSIDQAKRDISVVVAHYIVSLDATEYCISNGLLAAGATLVRREMEAVECCRGIFQGLQKKGQTPRLKALKHFGRLYGQFTSLAHSSGFDLLHNLAGEWPPSIDPIPNPEFSKLLLGVHIYTVLCVVGFVIADEAAFGPVVDLAHDLSDEALKLLCENDIITFKEENE